jgi:hypothetical protein
MIQIFNIIKINLSLLTNLYNKTVIEDYFTLICIYIYYNNNKPAKEFYSKEFYRAARGENIVFYGKEP